MTEIGDPKIDDPESVPLGTKIIGWELGSRSNKGGIIHFKLYDVVYQVFAFLIQDGA